MQRRAGVAEEGAAENEQRDLDARGGVRTRICRCSKVSKCNVEFRVRVANPSWVCHCRFALAFVVKACFLILHSSSSYRFVKILRPRLVLSLFV